MPGKGKMFPKSVTMNCQFTVLHTHKLGWQRSNWRGGNKFPYGTDKITGPYSHCPTGKGPKARPHKAKKKDAPAAARQIAKAASAITTGNLS